MGSLTNYVENKLMDLVFNKVVYDPPREWYLALLTGDPGDAALGSTAYEVAVGEGYERQQITFLDPDNRKIVQDGQISFPEAAGSWGTVTHWMVTDAATFRDGNALAVGAFLNSKTVTTGCVVSVLSAEVMIEFDTGGLSTYLANALLNHVFRGVGYGFTDTWIGLATSAVLDSDAGTTVIEPSPADAYARHLVHASGESGTNNWELSNSGMITNDLAGLVVIQFGPATGSWGTIESVFVCDASSAGDGNVLVYDNSMSVPIGAGDTLRISPAQCDWTMS
jgi:hypothetical protein